MGIEKITVTEFNTAYTEVTKTMIKEDSATPSLFNFVSKKLKDEFDSGGYSNEQKAIALGQFYSSAYSALESQATQSAKLILESDVQFDLINAQTAVTTREAAGFDDNLRVKEAEFNGQVAAFAVNANSTNMQAVVTRFNNSIDAITP